MLSLLFTAFGWNAWRAYDFRCAVREAEELGFQVTGSETPLDLIRADWHAAFERETWFGRERELYRPLNLGSERDRYTIAILHCFRASILLL